MLCSVSRSDGGDTAFEPEYGDTTAETIYTRVARHFLAMRSAVHNQPETVPAPDILHSAGIGHSRKLLDLPSWVPDWSSPHLYSAFGFAAELVQYRASLTSANGEVNTRQSSQSWTVRGRVIDMTSGLVEPLEVHLPTDVGTALPLQMEARTLQWHCRCSLAWVESICALLPIDECDPTGRPYYPDSVARTIIGNMTSHLQVTKAPPEYVDYFTEWQVFNKAVAATNIMHPDSEDLRAYFTQAQLPARFDPRGSGLSCSLWHYAVTTRDTVPTGVPVPQRISWSRASWSSARRYYLYHPRTTHAISSAHARRRWLLPGRGLLC